MADLFYLDYFNGFSVMPNANTIRLYKDIIKKEENTEKRTQQLICSAPYSDRLTYSVKNEYTDGTGGLVLNMLTTFANGVKEGKQLLGSAMMIGNQMANLINQAAGKDLMTFMNSPEYTKTMKDMLQAGKKPVVMPWEGSKFFTQSTLSIDGFNSLSFTITSSKSFYDYLNKFIMGNTVNRDTPVRSYINWLFENLAGKVNVGDTKRGTYDKDIKDENGELKHAKGTLKTLDAMSLRFESPTKEYDKLGFDKMSNIFSEKGSYNLNETEKGVYWVGIGDIHNSRKIPNLLVDNLTVSPSKELTENNDYLYANISISLSAIKRYTSDTFGNILGDKIDVQEL